MQAAAALWSVGSATAAEVVDAAGDLLVAGYDGPGLVVLAGVPARQAERVVSGALPPIDLVRWAHTTFGHEGRAERLAELDDEYAILGHTGMTGPDLTSAIIAEARRLAG